MQVTFFIFAQLKALVDAKLYSDFIVSFRTAC